MEQAEEELNNTGAPLETKIIQMFEDNTENITEEETNRIQIEDRTSLSDCKIYLVPILFFTILCIFVLLMFLKYRICAQ